MDKTIGQAQLEMEHLQHENQICKIALQRGFEQLQQLILFARDEVECMIKGTPQCCVWYLKSALTQAEGLESFEKQIAKTDKEIAQLKQQIQDILE